ncbi:hypothetical protein QFC20_003882 [Naganishia adeliensis]|uniref:Uncharacterized protein n=1 Tax=Naganishia adeliensis TaxID=92952 RepID=A0ACC2W8Q4_9TREE|nr:hypothetical protein QFC20_003882 [Naganishia adeliensis]
MSHSIFYQGHRILSLSIILTTQSSWDQEGDRSQTNSATEAASACCYADRANPQIAGHETRWYAQRADDECHGEYARTPFRKKSLGELIHHSFPNLKYAVGLAAPVRQITSPTASVYVSNRNFIERRDAAEFRKMFVGTIWEFRHGRNVPLIFTDVELIPGCRAVGDGLGRV